MEAGKGERDNGMGYGVIIGTSRGDRAGTLEKFTRIKAPDFHTVPILFPFIICLCSRGLTAPMF